MWRKIVNEIHVIATVIASCGAGSYFALAIVGLINFLPVTGMIDGNRHVGGEYHYDAYPETSHINLL